MKTYTIIGGVNGAGKSSLSGVLKSNTNLGRIIDVDKMAQSIGNIAAGKKAIGIIEDCLNRGISFTQETTLSGVKTLNTVKKAREAGFNVRLFYVGLDTAQESIKRIANRVAKGGHDIGTEDVLRRFKGRFDALIKILPYCNEVVLFDNDNGFVEVAQYKNGELIITTDSPEWLKKLKQLLE